MHWEINFFVYILIASKFLLFSSYKYIMWNLFGLLPNCHRKQCNLIVVNDADQIEVEN